jgi:hypothetical protein
MMKEALALLALVVATAHACARKPEPGPKLMPLSETGFRVEWVGHPSIPATVHAGNVFPVTVTVKNTSDQVWQDPKNSHPTTYAAGAVRLGYRWLKPSEKKAPNMGYGDARADLPQPLSPGGSATLTLEVAAPARPGDYELQIDLCQELVSWFEAKGAAPLKMPVKVT